MNRNRKPPRFPLSDGAPNPLETVALWLLGALIAVGTVLWSAGELSGRVFGGAWPGTPPAEMGGVLVRFRDHVGDPASAWPRPQREHLPGALAFYGTLGAALIPLVGATVVAYRKRARETRESGGSARWAKRRDLRLLRVREPLPGRLTIGRVDGSLVAAEPRQSVIVVGPVQTGKTSGFAVPAILEWQGPVVTTSVKTDLLRETLIARSALPGTNVWVYDPTGTTGIPSAGWTPLAGCEDWVGAQRTADWLVGGARRGNTGIDNADFWYAAAAKLLAPILFAATHSDGTMADVVRWIDTRNVDAVQAGLVRSGEPAADDAFQASIERDDRTRSSIYTTAETVLAAFADPGVLMSALTPDLRAERLLDGGCHTAYLCAPAHEQRRLQPLFATLVQEIVACAYDRATATGRPLDPPLLLVLDECANIAPLRDLATLASTGAGQGIQLVSIFQDMAQINAVYGRDRAPTIVSNHRAKVILSGIADAQTLDYVGRLLGDEEVSQLSSTSGAEGRRSTTESITLRSLAPANVLREMRPGRGLLVYGHLAPARVELRPWFRDRRLRRLAAGVT
ncbi:MAG: type IV secretory system conjugative DNA transfer family protein [Gaiellaceae bacterium]